MFGWLFGGGGTLRLIGHDLRLDNSKTLIPPSCTGSQPSSACPLDQTFGVEPTFVSGKFQNSDMVISF